MLTCSSTRSYLAGMKRAPDRSQKLPSLRQFESFPFPIKNVVGQSTCGVSTAISEMPRPHATSLPTTFFADNETSPKFLFSIGMVPPRYALLETTGRKTGKPRRTPVGNGLVGRQFWIVAEQGRKLATFAILWPTEGASETARWATGSLVHRHSPLTFRRRCTRAPALARESVAEQRQQCRRGPLFRHPTAHGSD
jgi:hypothetical protein